ncbi:thiamine pyrophosphate-requiring enzyme [Aspergillus saccharolyticus JOP 1030-1]|uniref:Thiamine pyrophosphate-requiring enzyme n=1 Tax=Aspergillus saccharolyticus JOP 1030-1 TaxID=1450539 RepID=A0A318ZYU6_9EURO|nr:thiamine pyrophosphate-requiring enzyme [Aspergillus saccharolyticus JOP 1030-1]PYH49463.1 thiamine pyrophosphate-requiring enzyme [Aspergillus saccharolyticus JOP 1030-1]
MIRGRQKETDQEKKEKQKGNSGGSVLHLHDLNDTMSNDLASKDRAGPTVADELLEALAEAGVDYLFTVLGSDHPSIIEAYVRRQNDPTRQYPKMILFQHEFVAMSAADGYARISHRPASVIAHVDVGTAALGQGLHNASSGRAPVVILAGIAPSTFLGEAVGSRSEHVQWYQDIRDQAALVAPYSRYSVEIKSPHNVSTVVHRAVLMATTGSPGPVYLTATREILATTLPHGDQPLRRKILPSCLLGSLPTEQVEVIGTALLEAQAPLVITGYLGRNHRAVHELVALADMIPGLRVFDSELREMSFPATHPACVTRGTGAAPAVQSADVILVLDADVPWIPTRVRPSSTAHIIHIDLDPRKERMNSFDIGASLTFQADTAAALSQLTSYFAASPRLSELQASESWKSRALIMQKAYREGQTQIDARAAALLSTPDAACSVDYLCNRVRHLLPQETIFVTDSVTNLVAMTEQLRLHRLGSHLTKGGSGLGWAGGAAIGVHLAAARYHLSHRPAHHGGWKLCLFHPHGRVLASHRYQCPFVTIILNNGGWNATSQCLKDVHPDGLAVGLSKEELGISLVADGPDYGGIAKAAANGNLWARRVECVGDLDEALAEAVRVVVDEAQSAVLDVLTR